MTLDKNVQRNSICCFKPLCLVPTAHVLNVNFYLDTLGKMYKITKWTFVYTFSNSKSLFEFALSIFTNSELSKRVKMKVQSVNWAISGGLSAQKIFQTINNHKFWPWAHCPCDLRNIVMECIRIMQGQTQHKLLPNILYHVIF